MKTRDEILSTLRVLKPELLARYKVREIGLFGSFVRGEHGETSDIDVLVDFEEDASLFDHMRLELFLEDVLHHKVDAVSREALRKEISEAVLKEVIMP